MYYLLKIISHVLAVLPAKWLKHVGVLAGCFWYYMLPVRKKTAIENVSISLTGGDRKKAGVIVRSSMINLCTGFLEFGARMYLPLPKIGVVGEQRLKDALATGKGAILATAHTGDWDLNEMVGVTEGVKLHLVSRRTKVGGLQRFWEELRARRGNVYLPQNVAATDLLKILKNGGCVVLAIDQHMPIKHGIRVPFFGREASTTYAPALLHLRTGAPVFPTFGAYESDGSYLLQLLPPMVAERTGDLRADTAAMTISLNRALEDYIKNHPDQWLWFHRRWKS